MSAGEHLITFPVRSGIFGVDRLAKRLKALQAEDRIGNWRIGHWLDWRHTEIQISFDTVADASHARLVCYDAGTPPDLKP